MVYLAATRLITLHARRGKGKAASMRERLEYAQNPDKTEQGTLVSSYECDPRTAWEEFLLTQQELDARGRPNTRSNVIAYQIRQSFRPGEITPEEANKVGYETAIRFTKGRHAFTVSTHTDRAHIHNHIIFNSASMDASGRWQNFHLSGKALQKLSDIVCLEHGLSVIEEHSHVRRKIEWPKRRTVRNRIRGDIDRCLEKNPKSMKALLEMLRSEGYEVRRGKYISLKNADQKNFIRLRSLGDGYTEEDLAEALARDMRDRKARDGNRHENADRPFSLMIDIEKKLREGKGPGYEHWAKSFNLKQTAEVLLFLQEHGVESMADLDAKTDRAVKHFHELSDEIRSCEARLKEIGALKKHIIDYSKTRDVYTAYRKAGYSKRFYEEHRAEIEIHKAAKAAFDRLGTKKIPKVRDLSAEYGEILAQKRKAYAAYKEAKEEMRNWTVAKKNVQMVLGEEEKKAREKEERGL